MKRDALPEDGADDGWYGKIPAAGDFVHRRVSRQWIALWDAWLRHGLAALEPMSPAVRREFAAAPIWNFAIPAGTGGGAIRLGCLAPSRDRVGRLYPVGTVRSIAAADYEPHMLGGADAYYRASAQALLNAVRHGCDADRLDAELRHAGSRLTYSPTAAQAAAPGDIMQILNAGRPDAPVSAPAAHGTWPDLAHYFNAGSHTSYWWTSQVDGAAHQTYVHGGALNATLFSRLFLATGSGRW